MIDIKKQNKERNSILIDLFTPQIKSKLHNKNFNNITHPSRQAEREILNEWVNGFVDRDGKLVKEFQSTFNSTFWEIYLFAAFKEYQHKIDWSHNTPDFLVSDKNTAVVVEAVTANAARGKPNEWDKKIDMEDLKSLKRFTALNTEAMIRISNSFVSKVEKYRKAYGELSHVKNKPFVIAVAPFEQPHFHHQYDRPIKALLYDHYVDEDASLDAPEMYPDGPPTIQLGCIEKENGSEIELGFFNDEMFSEVSAVIYSCTATWGKLTAMSNDESKVCFVSSIWTTPPFGASEVRSEKAVDCKEQLLDGLQIYHNPYASNPLPFDFFKAKGVVQVYLDENNKWVHEEANNCLQFRQTMTLSKATPEEWKKLEEQDVSAKINEE